MTAHTSCTLAGYADPASGTITLTDSAQAEHHVGHIPPANDTHSGDAA